MTNQEIKTLVEFGNFLLSEERKKTIENKQLLNVVTDADVENFKYLKSKDGKG